MQEYISKPQPILRPAEQIYAVISRFDNLTPAVAAKVEEWQATADTLSLIHIERCIRDRCTT